MRNKNKYLRSRRKSRGNFYSAWASPLHKKPQRNNKLAHCTVGNRFQHLNVILYPLLNGSKYMHSIMASGSSSSDLPNDRNFHQILGLELYWKSLNMFLKFSFNSLSTYLSLCLFVVSRIMCWSNFTMEISTGRHSLKWLNVVFKKIMIHGHMTILSK
jgi:hypothetical protein